MVVDPTFVDVEVEDEEVVQNFSSKEHDVDDTSADPRTGNEGLLE